MEPAAVESRAPVAPVARRSGQKLSAATKKLREEEEIALPETPDYDSRITGGLIGSPLSAEQMGRRPTRISSTCSRY